MRARTAVPLVALLCAVVPLHAHRQAAVVQEPAPLPQVEFTAADLAKQLNDVGSVVLHGIRFDTGKATIDPDSKPVLASIGQLLKDDPALKLEVQGHTDNVGSPTVNLRLSQDRAAAVKNYIVTTFKIAPQRLSAVGFGDTKPIADNATETGRAQNQRVELAKLAGPSVTER